MKPPEHLELLAWCTAAAVLLVGVLALHSRQRGLARPDAIALALSLVLAASAVWIQTHGFYISRTNDFHYHEHFHYVLSSKYFDELGYQDLYPATIVAAEESGPRLPITSFREMEQYQVLPVEQVRQDAARYRTLFSESRWQEWKDDVAAFRRWIESRPHAQNSWRRLLIDRGFSGTPAWTWVAGQISSRLAISAQTLWVLSQLDVALLVIGFVLIARSFGLWGVALSLLLWGCGYLTYYMVTGGAFLRNDWYAAFIAGSCALVAKRNGLAGAMIGYSAAMRLFPGLLAVVVGVQALVEWRQHRRLDSPGVRFLAGFALVLALMVGGSAVQYGAGSWLSFSDKILTHTDYYRVRSIGLDYLFVYGGEESTRTELRTLGMEGYKSKHLAQLNERKPWIRVVQLLFGMGVVAVLIRRKVDLLGASVLGCAMIPILLSPTTYYYGFMVVPLLAFSRAWPQPLAVVGILWLLLEALLGYVLELQQTTRFLNQFLMSSSVTGFCAYLIAWVASSAPARRSLPATLRGSPTELA